MTSEWTTRPPDVEGWYWVKYKGWRKVYVTRPAWVVLNQLGPNDTAITRVLTEKNGPIIYPEIYPDMLFGPKLEEPG